MPRKKSRTDPPVHDSPRKTSLRLRPVTPVEVRMSPRKTAQAPTAKTRPETPRKGSNAGAQKEGGAQVKQKKDVCTTEQLHATNNGSKTQVV